MDPDLRENLIELSDHLQAVSRQVGSNKNSMAELEQISECLRMGARTLDKYIEIQKTRY